MKSIIHKIEIIPISIELKNPFVISVGAITHGMNTVIKIYTSDGEFGTGECCRYRSIYSETQEGIIAAGQKLAPLLIGQDVMQISKCVSIMDKNFVGYSSIKCAYDMALHDLKAKLLGVPLYKMLGGDADRKMYTDMTIGFLEKEKMAAKAEEYTGQGFPALKIKLGDRKAISDIERIEAIRGAIGYDMPLRVDANQGWNYLRALQVLNGIEEYEVEHCEAPVPAQNFIDLRKLREESPIPIMGDESIYSHQDTYRMIAEGCVDLVNIKLGKSGGICHAMKIAAVAEAAGMDCQVGCFSESRLAITALAHFSKVWDNIIYHDMDSPLMQSEDPVIGGLSYTKDWEVLITEEPGHGAHFDPAYLNKFENIVVS